MRRYASFFQWHDRQRAELGVVEELIEELSRQGTRTLKAPASHEPDPPDCVCTNEVGERVAIEVTEVVSPEAIQANEHGEDVYRDWKAGELRSHVARQLAGKDSKSFHGGPYSEVLICLFTDEPMLTEGFVRRELEGHPFGPFRQVTGAYLLLSYDAGTKTCPVQILNIHR